MRLVDGSRAGLRTAPADYGPQATPRRRLLQDWLGRGKENPLRAVDCECEVKRESQSSIRCCVPLTLLCQCNPGAVHPPS